MSEDIKMDNDINSKKPPKSTDCKPAAKDIHITPPPAKSRKLTEETPEEVDAFIHNLLHVGKDKRPAEATLWVTVVYYVKLFEHYATSIKLVDKMQAALFITWVCAWFGLYMSKIFERLFKIILSMPDSWLGGPAGIICPPKNKQGANINILNARTEHGSITNKLKLFLKFYWEKEDHAFDFANLSKMLNCSMLYCCYLLSASPNEMTPDEFFNNVNRFLVSCTNDKCTRFVNSELNDGHQLSMRRVDFDMLSERDGIVNDELNYIKNMIAELDANE